MLRIPEYHLLRARDPHAATVTVSVTIDGRSPVPSIVMRADVLANLAAAHSNGGLRFMSFDEHPMRLVRIDRSGSGERATARLTARSVTEEDEFPRDWQSIGPEVFDPGP